MNGVSFHAAESRFHRPPSMRVLFVAGEVAPFSETTATAQVLRTLPEALQEHKDVDERSVLGFLPDPGSVVSCE